MRRRLVVVEVALEVDVDDRVPLLLGHLPDDAVPGDAGVADQNVEAAERLEHPRHHGLGVGVARHVGLDRQTLATQLLDLGHDRLGLVVVASVVDRHVGALARQLERDRPADAEAAAGDDGALSFESQLHLRPPHP